MTLNNPKEHIWVGRCGCYSDIKKPSWKPWFWRPRWPENNLRAVFLGGDEYGRNRVEILWDALRPFFFGGDEYCRKTLVIGYGFTGRIIIPLVGHTEKSCGECPMERPEGGCEIDFYLKTWQEIDAEDKMLRARAKRIKHLSKRNKYPS